MKLIVASLLIAAASAARLENTYLPPSSAQSAGGSGSFLRTPSGGGFGGAGAGFGGNAFARGGHGGAGGFGAAGAGAFGAGAASGFGAGGAGGFGAGGAYSGSGSSGFGRSGAGAHIGIIRFNNQNEGDGTYNYEYQTENRIQAQESGQLRNIGGEAAVVAQGSYSYQSPEGATITVNYIADENGFQPVGDHLPTPPPIPAEILESLRKNAADEAAGISDDGQYRGNQGGGFSGSGFRSGSGAGSVNRQYLAPSPAGRQQGGYRY